jgi:hypothetical protein
MLWLTTHVRQCSLARKGKRYHLHQTDNAKKGYDQGNKAHIEEDDGGNDQS